MSCVISFLSYISITSYLFVLVHPSYWFHENVAHYLYHASFSFKKRNSLINKVHTGYRKYRIVPDTKIQRYDWIIHIPVLDKKYLIQVHRTDIVDVRNRRVLWLVLVLVDYLLEQRLRNLLVSQRYQTIPHEGTNAISWWEWFLVWLEINSRVIINAVIGPNIRSLNFATSKAAPFDSKELFF